MTKKYQTKTIDTNSLAVPEQVSGDGRDRRRHAGRVLALAVGTGLQVMAALMDPDVTAPGRPPRAP